MPAMTVADAATRIPDLTYRQLDHWIKQGHVRCADGNHPGTGNKRILSGNEVRVVRVLSRLRAAGVEMAQAAAIARWYADPEQESVVRAEVGPGVHIEFDLTGTATREAEEANAA